jgi:WD40 repeat protein
MGSVYSKDGKKILSASDDNTIKEWDTVTGECLRTLKGHTDIVESAVYSEDGKKILSDSRDNTIKEWDAVTGECVKTLIGYKRYYVDSAVYSGDGKKILSTSPDKTIKEWDTVTGECLRTLKGHTDYVRSAVYSEDGKKILSASWDNTIKEWDAQSGKYLESDEGDPSSLSAPQNIQHVTNMPEKDKTEIEIKNESTGKVLKILINIPGLWIQGCSFATLHPDCRFTEEELKLLKMYGAVL